MSTLKHLFNLRNIHKQLMFIMLMSFVLSFAVVRSFSLIIGKSIFIRGYQIHHFYFGTFFLAVGGIIAVMSARENVRRSASSLLGIGLGLFADEIGLLLNCTTETSRNCQYAFPNEYDFIAIIAAILILLMATTHPIERLVGKIATSKD